jgi:hypothetical protein
MPWNPMKVEQRIGRAHRYKQKDTVLVCNLFAADTIEDRIYQRLEEKLFEITQTIGNEDEKEAFRENILGIVAEELNFDELYKDLLKKGQQVDEITKEMIDSAIERAKDVYRKLGDFTQDMEKFSLDKYFETKGHLSLDDLKDFVLGFVRSEGKKISVDEEENYEFIIPDSITTYGGQKYKGITFDREKAIEDPGLEFFAIGHHITDSIINRCTGYSYGGRCARRIISNSEAKGETGIQFNFTIEYQSPQPGQEKPKTLRKDFITIIFDKDCKYREDLEILGRMESQKKVSETDFSFATESYLEQVEEAANARIQQVIEEDIQTLQSDYPNVIFKRILENIALFVVK